MKLNKQTKTNLRLLWIMFEVAVVIFALVDLSKKNPSHIEVMAPVGTVIKKEQQGQKHTVTIKGYGKFLVTKEEYEQIELGDKVLRFLVERGQ
ncbi:DUF1372 family protein [Streptococcus sp. sy004]|uniref:DUF1372 family protein n=1 Tax=Streptococcus sp. sy004 TaxID=2600149 RepID=UPI0011B36025|nr:DUF1372 family protein [Streptococcus sp. sy004]TWT12059.1 DUF1372 family protein [Streptococcus sp. sy004]